ncbi:hypothetical protein AVEN_46797-1 [Araneus ventricosus]|uniref:Uncharacterized protein n=1 Tax=Araneus ventricosus TaxID=182803 RepID=A0A4Y2TKI5_ARAVE|nr:hypothetical protein AVEN_46797-1 [Araneus ventricosus]
MIHWNDFGVSSAVRARKPSNAGRVITKYKLLAISSHIRHQLWYICRTLKEILRNHHRKSRCPEGDIPHSLLHLFIASEVTSRFGISPSCSWDKVVHPCFIACDDPEKKVISLPLVPHQVFEAYCHSCSLVIRVPKALTKTPTSQQLRSCPIRLSPFSCIEVSTVLTPLPKQ